MKNKFKPIQPQNWRINFLNDCNSYIKQTNENYISNKIFKYAIVCELLFIDKSEVSFVFEYVYATNMLQFTFNTREIEDFNFQKEEIYDFISKTVVEYDVIPFLPDINNIKWTIYQNEHLFKKNNSIIWKDISNYELLKPIVSYWEKNIELNCNNILEYTREESKSKY